MFADSLHFWKHPFKIKTFIHPRTKILQLIGNGRETSNFCIYIPTPFGPSGLIPIGRSTINSPINPFNPNGNFPMMHLGPFPKAELKCYELKSYDSGEDNTGMKFAMPLCQSLASIAHLSSYCHCLTSLQDHG